MRSCEKIFITMGLSLSLLVGFLPFSDRAEGALAPLVNTHSVITEGASTPVRLAGDPFGNIYVTDPRGGGILKYNSAGKLQQTITTIKNGLGIAVAGNGDLLVSQGSTVAVLDKTSGTQKARFGTFVKANGIAVDNNGFIYVTDSSDNCVQLFNAAYAPVSSGVASSGKPANSFGTTGRNAGQFMQPSGISFEKISNQLAVVDSLNGRVQFFSTAGAYQKSLGSFGAGPLQFTSPQSIAFEYSPDNRTLSRIYVVDTYQSNVQVIDAATGSFLRYIGSYGLVSGKLIVPADILYDRFDALNNRLIVSNGSGALALFGIDSGGVTPPASGPALTINSVPQVTNLSALTISGTTSSGATVKVNGADAQVVGTAWSSTVNLLTGVNTVSVVASDGSGSTAKSVSVTLLSSSGTPVLLTLSPLPAIVATSPITLSGTVTSGATVLINGTAATVSGTDWSLPVTLTQGANNLLIVASKPGLSESTTSVNLTMDSVPPVLTAFLPTDGSSTSTAVQTISGTVTDVTATSVAILVNGVSRSIPVSDGQFSQAIVLAGGSNSIGVSASDAAGNSSSSASVSITYNPLYPLVTLTSAGGAASGSESYTLNGTAPAGCSVSVNGIPAVVTAGAWRLPVTLTRGMNHFEIMASDPASDRTSTIVTSVTYAPGSPALAITEPQQDIATAKKSSILKINATPGVSVSATVNGAAVPVTSVGNGIFNLTLPAFADPGSYGVVVSASDGYGASSTTYRTLIYDPSVPAISVLSAAPPKVTSTGGALVAIDKNGPVGSAALSGGISTLDLTGIAYDPASLNIYAVSAAGTSTRNGDVSLDGKVDISDALKSLRIIVGVEQPATYLQMLHGDIGPLTNNQPTVDGALTISDALAILRKVVGLEQ